MERENPFTRAEKLRHSIYSHVSFQKSSTPNTLSQWETSDRKRKPNIVVVIQKEMFRDHFFFDKMEKVTLEPLKPEQMVEAYRKRFKAIEPFT